MVGKLSTRDTTFLETSPQSEVYTQSYKSSKVVRVPILGVSRFPSGSLKTK
jgi:hypothetical protein